MRFIFIDAKKAEFPISRMCKLLGVSASGFDAWKDRPACQRQGQDMVLLAHIRSAFKLSNGTCGSPRMTRKLRDNGHPVGRRRTARLMRENDLVARRIVGWATSGRLRRALPLSALKKALVIRQPEAGLIHHSDRGSQYCAVDYQGDLRRHGIRISMSGKRNCYDNAMVEAFFKTIKSELVWRTRFQTRQDAEQAIARYIDGFYNPVRRHSALGYQSPVQFENRTRQTS